MASAHLARPVCPTVEFGHNLRKTINSWLVLITPNVSAKICCFLCFEWKNRISPLFPLRRKILEKSHSDPHVEKTPMPVAFFRALGEKFIELS